MGPAKHQTRLIDSASKFAIELRTPPQILQRTGSKTVWADSIMAVVLVNSSRASAREWVVDGDESPDLSVLRHASEPILSTTDFDEAELMS